MLPILLLFYLFYLNSTVMGVLPWRGSNMTESRKMCVSLVFIFPKPVSLWEWNGGLGSLKGNRLPHLHPKWLKYNPWDGGKRRQGGPARKEHGRGPWERSYVHTYWVSILRGELQRPREGMAEHYLQALETTVNPPKFFVVPVLRSGRRTPEPVGMAWKQERKGFQVLRGPWTKDTSETNCQSPWWGGSGHLVNTSMGTKMEANCHVLLPLPKTLTSAQGKWGTLHSLRLNFSTLVKYDLE